MFEWLTSIFTRRPKYVVSGDLADELSPYIGRVYNRQSRAKRIDHRPSVVEDEAMRLAAEDLVIRTRAGDQVAIAVIFNIGQNAKAGNPRSIKAKRYIEECIARIPLRSTIDYRLSTIDSFSGQQPIAHSHLHKALTRVVVAGDENYGQDIITLLPAAGWRGVILLANGPSLIKTGKVRAVAQTIPDPSHRHAFCTGQRYAGRAYDISERRRLDPQVKAALELGEAFGLAQKVQAVRRPEARISDFDPETGWELGE